MPRKASPNSSKYYFTAETEKAIVEYNQTEDYKLKNEIFNQHIRQPLNKIAENLIHRFKFYHFDIPYEDVKHETVAHLYQQLGKYTSDKGKAFSYFSIVAKNYLIYENNNNYYKSKNTDDLLVVDEVRPIINEVIRNNRIEDEKEFMDLFVKYVEDRLSLFTIQETRKNNKIVFSPMFESKLDHLIVDSILELFRKRENIEVYNKKALYILIKERSGTDKTQEITKNLKRVHLLYSDIFDNWSKTGKLSTKYIKSYNYLK